MLILNDIINLAQQVKVSSHQEIKEGTKRSIWKHFACDHCEEVSGRANVKKLIQMYNAIFKFLLPRETFTIVSYFDQLPYPFEYHADGLMIQNLKTV